MTRNLLAALAFAMAAGAIASPPALAKDSKPAPEMSEACRALKDTMAALLKDYDRMKARDSKDSRLPNVRKSIFDVGKEWSNTGCKDKYGAISLETLPPMPPRGPAGDVVVGPQGPNSPGTFSTGRAVTGPVTNLKKMQ